MREIKFRAWDNVKNRMLHLGEEEYIIFEPTDYGFRAYDIDHEPGEPNYYLEHLKYMQFTGIYDKNLKEIYEGDILKSKHSKENGVNLVVWQNNGFMIEFTFTRKWDGGEYEDRNYLPIYGDSYEVIGNIHENPELLKEEVK